jgi:hypothetical protein
VRGQWALPGPAHHVVDVAVQVHVDRVRGAGGERPADEGRDDLPHGRQPPGGEDHRGDRDDQQQDDDPGLGQRQVGANGVAERRARVGLGLGTLGVGDRLPDGRLAPCDDGERDDDGPDQRRQGDVEGACPGRELGHHVGPADEDLRREQDEREGREPHEPPRARSHRARADRRPPERREHDDREHPVGEHRDRPGVIERRHEALAHQGPLAEGEPRALRADVGADQQQAIGRGGGDDREPRVGTVAAAAVHPRARDDHDERGQHEERDREMDGDDGGILLRGDDPAADRRLRHEQRQQQDRQDRGDPVDRLSADERPPADDGEHERERPGDERERAMGVLDQRVVLGAGDPRAEAPWPVGAAVARAGRTDHAAPGDQHERRDERCRGDGSEAARHGRAPS